MGNTTPGAPAQNGPPKIILKLDDVGPQGHDASAAWRETMDFLGAQRIPASIGLIGKCLEQPKDPLLHWLHDQSAQGHEIWNHGYAHDREMDSPLEDGRPKSEFHGRPFNRQLAALQRTQSLAKDRLGITLTTFGAPFNATDRQTAAALETIKELKVWMFKETAHPTTKHILRRLPEVNIEYPVHVPDYDRFLAGFRKQRAQNTLVLQGHPNSWFEDRARFTAFKKIVTFLANEAAEFSLPREYA